MKPMDAVSRQYRQIAGLEPEAAPHAKAEKSEAKAEKAEAKAEAKAK
jgi:hypothetical protein